MPLTLTLVSISKIKWYCYKTHTYMHISLTADSKRSRCGTCSGCKVNVVVAKTIKIRKNLVDQEDGSKLALKGNVTI